MNDKVALIVSLFGTFYQGLDKAMLYNIIPFILSRKVVNA